MTLISATILLAAHSPSIGYTPPSGFVPDAKTACAIARAVALPIYGHAVIDKEEPLGALLRGGTWIVTGHVPKLKPPYAFLGGVLEVHISKKSGTIQSLWHEK